MWAMLAQRSSENGSVSFGGSLLGNGDVVEFLHFWPGFKSESPKTPLDLTLHSNTRKLPPIHFPL